MVRQRRTCEIRDGDGDGMDARSTTSNNGREETRQEKKTTEKSRMTDVGCTLYWIGVWCGVVSCDDGMVCRLIWYVDAM